ncbi:MAG: DUF4389 domain-containing protein [Actinobacteria bacterium]|nr:DUF4389 domain-containing protein [Actinomycetota bacterium]
MPKNIYPTLTAELIKNPSRFYAFPILGILVKVIIVIPIFIELMFLSIVYFFVSIINSFSVLFTGRYWDLAYQLVLGLMRLNTKIYFFMSGLTNKYPGFNFTINDTFNVEMAKPEKPNRLFAFPILGGIVRVILLIPYLVYTYVIQNAANIGVFVSFVPVLFMGKYPESTYELARDGNRLSLSSSAYMGGLSDSYPSFWISMNHKTAKIILIILGALIAIVNFFSPRSSQQYNYQKTEEFNFNNQDIQTNFPETP